MVIINSSKDDVNVWQDDKLTISGTSSYDPSTQHIVRSDVPEPVITLTLHRGSADTNCPLPGS